MNQMKSIWANAYMTLYEAGRYTFTASRKHLMTSPSISVGILWFESAWLAAKLKYLKAVGISSSLSSSDLLEEERSSLQRTTISLISCVQFPAPNLTQTHKAQISAVVTAVLEMSKELRGNLRIYRRYSIAYSMPSGCSSSLERCRKVRAS